MNDYRVNTNYAKALFLLASDTEALEQVHTDMRLVEQVCGENRELNVVFANPTVPSARKQRIVEALFAAHVCEVTMVFLRFVVRKSRAVNLKGISKAFIQMYRDERGIVLSDLVTHQPIDETARRMVTQMVADYTGKNVELHDRTDVKMLGGFKLEFDNKMYDARIRTKIRKLRLAFANNEYESKL